MGRLLFTNNARTTLAGGINNVATSALLAAGSGALFPNPSPGSGDSFRLTFVDAATGNLAEIVNVTGRSGDTITMQRGQEGTTALPWLAGDFALHLCTAGSMGVMSQRTELAANLTYYVSPTGSDSNDGLTSLTPFLTIQHAVQVAYGFDLNGFIVTIRILPGTYTAGASLSGALAGQPGPEGLVFEAIDGTVVINSPNSCFFAGGASSFSLVGNGFDLTSPSGSSSLVTAIGAQGGSTINIHGNITYHGSRDADVFAAIGAAVNYMTVGQQETIAYNSSQQAHFLALNGGSIIMASPVTLTSQITGNATYSNGFAVGSGCSIIAASGYSFTLAGGTVTGPRYNLGFNSVTTVNGRGGLVFPGTIAGVVANGGQYG